jgi:hypothetical protein
MAKPTVGMLGAGLAEKAGIVINKRGSRLDAAEEAAVDTDDGIVEPGNIKGKARKPLAVNIDDEELLIPTISDDGKELGAKEAIEHYRKTGMHHGKFKSQDYSTKYASKLK